jgi:hypothetical protein
VPLDWALTQNNMGSALAWLGGQEAGTGHIEEAAEVCREALVVFRDAGATNYISIAERNLVRAEAELAKRTEGS